MQRSDCRQSGNSLKFHGFLFVWALIGALSAGGVPFSPAAGHAAEALIPEIIVIDPGHGGHDHGVQGPAGTLEKDVALHLARILSAVLAPEYTAVLTRSGDYQLDNVKRASAANYHRARLFIAIHTGGGFLHQMDRWSVFYYNKDEIQNQPPDSGPGAAAEHRAAAGIPWDHAQQAHEQESRDLAECIRSQLAGHPEISEVHVAGAALRMLQGIDRPAIAIEAGYLTNPETENRLNDGEFLTDVARRIKRGIDVYLSR